MSGGARYSFYTPGGEQAEAGGSGGGGSAPAPAPAAAAPSSTDQIGSIAAAAAAPAAVRAGKTPGPLLQKMKGGAQFRLVHLAFVFLRRTFF